MRVLAEFREHLCGELVLMLVADRAPAVGTGRNSCWRRGPSSPAMR